MKQVIGEKALRRINDKTGNGYIEAYHRGNWGRWFQCVLPPTIEGDRRLMNCDMVHRDSGEVIPEYRDGRLV